MELLIGIVVVGVVLFFVFSFGAKMGQDAAKNTSSFASHDVRTAQAHDRNNLLNTWRREIANLLVWRNPDHYIEFYRSLHTEVSSFKDWKRDVLEAKYDEIAKRYPQYADFDPFATRLHVLYPDARRHSDEELECVFADITRFQAILCTTKSDWKWFEATSDSDLHHLIKYAASIKDTKFQLRLERAVDNFDLWNSAKNDEIVDRTDVFEFRHTEVRRVSHFAENRYGVHFKDTNEFGLYGYFISDAGRIYYSYYRSDSTFQEERHLDVLSGVADDYRNRLQPVTKIRSGSLLWKPEEAL